MSPDSDSSLPDPAPASPSPEDSTKMVQFIRWFLRKLGVSSRFIARHSFRTASYLLRALAYGFVGSFLMLLVVGVSYLNGRPDLFDWHTDRLKEEFEASDSDRSFAEYLEREDRLFEELDQKIYAPVPPTTDRVFQRFRPGGLSNPREFEQDWNQTFELRPEEGHSATAGILLLHGMSDSPYSLRSLGQTLHQEGAHVIGLRLPGHGTAPSGLTRVEWEDMDAAVELAMRHLRDSIGKEAPLYLVGYSNGGALAVLYSLHSLEDDSLPKASGIVLLSPAIGVTPMAALAPWQARLGRLLGLNKLAWNSIGPEYDPYKYVSFAVNAGYQVRRLTLEIGGEMDRQEGRGELENLPPILAFQSIVDSTVSAPALIERLFARLPVEQDHELVLFDINRSVGLEGLMREDPTATVEALLARKRESFTLTILGNRDASSREVLARSYLPGNDSPESLDIGLEWPQGIYSLSHVAVPFSGTDPIYGSYDLIPPSERGELNLGHTALRGENGVLRISPADQLRLRWNPFYPYLKDRVLEFLKLDGDPES